MHCSRLMSNNKIFTYLLTYLCCPYWCIQTSRRGDRSDGLLLFTRINTCTYHYFCDRKQTQNITEVLFGILTERSPLPLDLQCLSVVSVAVIAYRRAGVKSLARNYICYGSAVDAAKTVRHRRCLQQKALLSFSRVSHFGRTWKHPHTTSVVGHSPTTFPLSVDSASWLPSLLIRLNVKQVAQLSQRDRAAGWVSNGQKWKTGTERNIYRQYRSIQPLQCVVFGQQRNRNRRKTQNKGCYAV